MTMVPQKTATTDNLPSSGNCHKLVFTKMTWLEEKSYYNFNFIRFV